MKNEQGQEIKINTRKVFELTDKSISNNTRLYFAYILSIADQANDPVIELTNAEVEKQTGLSAKQITAAKFELMEMDFLKMVVPRKRDSLSKNTKAFELINCFERATTPKTNNASSRTQVDFTCLTFDDLSSRLAAQQFPITDSSLSYVTGNIDLLSREDEDGNGLYNFYVIYFLLKNAKKLGHIADIIARVEYEDEDDE